MRDQDNTEMIIAEVLAGNREAFAVLVDQYKSGLYRLLLGLGASHQDAQDLAQDTFIQAYQKLRSHNGQSSFSAWLYTIAINRFKSQKRRKSFSFTGGVFPEQRAEEPTPEERYMIKENKLEMQKKLDRLPERYRIVLLLRYTGELTYEEISAVTGMNLHQVKNRLHRARLKLKKQWPTAKEDSNEKMGLPYTR
ncbi:RNA polymerase sigma factor [Paenibacillus sp. MMS20-IR301]|uniref:RNA polymerase sigma factor n=1 Tax=Paenibacillus sp. MMS20-IR301 TaxID=2895946 RepID=UPI0028E8A8B9|nr:RNA polymerase sigma factor [Paenibacillus sp. MMS20-IR301]WNS45615.1 RNA polymerase sigma factor [Paenibacillus sp. MMS20-IR301]